MKADETREAKEANGAKETNAAARGFDKAFDKVLGRSGASRPADGARSLRTAMTGRLVREWLVGWALSVVALTALFFIAMGLCRLRIWYVWDPLYQTLITFKYRAPIYMTGLALAAGIVTAVVAAVRGARRAGDYLDGVARAAEGLVSAPGTLVELPAELSEIETRLNAARARAAAAEARADLETRRKNDLLVYLAHDLKTPLTSVIGYLQLLRDEGDISAKLRRRYEGVALEKAQRLEDLVNEFFEVARLNLTDAALVRADVNLSRMVEQELFELAPSMEPKRLSYSLKADPGIVVSCDAGKVERVLDNLLRNAVSYSRPDTKIEVELRREERNGAAGARLRMTNHGDTIDPVQLERLFEQFYRLSSSRDADTGGAGLGLAIARKLVEAHGGSIKAASAEGSVTFEVWLPEKAPKPDAGLS